MRHIHVEIARKEVPVEPPVQQGGLPASRAHALALDSRPAPRLVRPFGEEEIKLQKAYQLSIFSQLGGFSELPEGQRLARAGGKRSSEEPLSEPKRLHLEDSWEDGPHAELVQEYQLPVDTLEGQALCCPNLLQMSPPTQATITPPRACVSTQQNHNQLVPSTETPGSPKNQSQADHPFELSGTISQTPHPRTGFSLGGSSTDGFHNGGTAKSEMDSASSSLEGCSDRTVGGGSSSSVHNSPASPDKTPSGARTPLPGPGCPPLGACPAKRRLLSPSDTGESCSEDEGPSTSKRSRLTSLGPGLGLGSCRSTDAKAAPFWNHLLPAAREWPKGVTPDCPRGARRLKSGLRLKSHQLRSRWRGERSRAGHSPWPAASISRSLLGSFEESILKGRFSPSGQIEGFTAEIGASGSYCPQHATLPVQVTYYDISEQSAPSPFLGVIYLETLGKKGYSVPKAGTIQVTLFNPNKTVVKMFLVTYNCDDMPVNHVTFLRHRIFLVPVEEGEKPTVQSEEGTAERKKILCYLIHLRFQSSKSGKIYLHDDIRLLFSRKSIEVDAGIPYELKSFTEVPRNPKYSPRV
ncbi:protein FAM214B-like [Brienomyrus brachyistius]|uniref:protein FAM214B-like n=1 Tax=Brienomyrus brachyistius TaxID=42636 RepID=UPI0020B43955|nr:protein FAM214B-like [Brienomyrus brachyistius]XP_048876444.1 protein FAM214B-like [Brienomyrus brachyistius]